MAEWSEEIEEEAHLEYLRGKINIDGMTEGELIEYAKLLSQGNAVLNDGKNNNNDGNDDDRELQLALKLSLIEM